MRTRNACSPNLGTFARISAASLSLSISSPELFCAWLPGREESSVSTGIENVSPSTTCSLEETWSSTSQWSNQVIQYNITLIINSFLLPLQLRNKTQTSGDWSVRRLYRYHSLSCKILKNVCCLLDNKRSIRLWETRFAWYVYLCYVSLVFTSYCCWGNLIFELKFLAPIVLGVLLSTRIDLSPVRNCIKVLWFSKSYGYFRNTDYNLTEIFAQQCIKDDVQTTKCGELL